MLLANFKFILLSFFLLSLIKNKEKGTVNEIYIVFEMDGEHGSGSRCKETPDILPVSSCFRVFPLRPSPFFLVMLFTPAPPYQKNKIKIK